MLKEKYLKLEKKLIVFAAEAYGEKLDGEELLSKCLTLGMELDNLLKEETEVLDTINSKTEELIKANKELAKQLEDIQKAQNFEFAKAETFRTQLTEKVDRIVLVTEEPKKKSEK